MLFSDSVTRLKALSLKKEIEENAKIYVHRNHSFEMVGNVLNAFLNFSDIEAQILYSSYDDSLTFGEIQNADLHILWLDLDRYDKNNIFEFLNEKILELKNLTTSPVLLACCGEVTSKINFNIPDVYFVNINKIIKKLNEQAFDLAKEAVLGTKLSVKSAIKIAQYLGLKIIPSIIKPALKAIVLDLDNTLYQGIIGEDGIKNVIANNKLQNKLKELKAQGFLLCIASKNDEIDAKKLFDERKDFILNWEDFTISQINWNSKSQNMVKIAADLNIGLDSILFIDDNIAEIEAMNSLNPTIKTILATSEDDVVNKLNLYPCLMKKTTSKEDTLRSNDLKANKERANLAKALSKEEYFKKLQMKIEITLNDSENKARTTELLNKTNQFILSYKRYNETEVINLLNSKDSCIITAKMSDKLSDSGMIAILIAKNKNDNLYVDELTFSCRALGRNIEDIVISKMILMAKEYLKTSDTAYINYKKGPRNLPALTWLENFTNTNLKEEDSIQYSLKNKIETFGLEIKELCKVN